MSHKPILIALGLEDTIDPEEVPMELTEEETLLTEDDLRDIVQEIRNNAELGENLQVTAEGFESLQRKLMKVSAEAFNDAQTFSMVQVAIDTRFNNAGATTPKAIQEAYVNNPEAAVAMGIEAAGEIVGRAGKAISDTIVAILKHIRELFNRLLVGLNAWASKYTKMAIERLKKNYSDVGDIEVDVPPTMFSALGWDGELVPDRLAKEIDRICLLAEYVFLTDVDNFIKEMETMKTEVKKLSDDNTVDKAEVLGRLIETSTATPPSSLIAHYMGGAIAEVDKEDHGLILTHGNPEIKQIDRTIKFNTKHLQDTMNASVKLVKIVNRGNDSYNRIEKTLGELQTTFIENNVSVKGLASAARKRLNNISFMLMLSGRIVTNITSLEKLFLRTINARYRVFMASQNLDNLGGGVYTINGVVVDDNDSRLSEVLSQSDEIWSDGKVIVQNSGVVAKTLGNKILISVTPLEKDSSGRDSPITVYADNLNFVKFNTHIKSIQGYLKTIKRTISSATLNALKTLTNKV